jgi:hypothetical protein
MNADIIAIIADYCKPIKLAKLYLIAAYYMINMMITCRQNKIIIYNYKFVYTCDFDNTRHIYHKYNNEYIIMRFGNSIFYKNRINEYICYNKSPKYNIYISLGISDKFEIILKDNQLCYRSMYPNNPYYISYISHIDIADIADIIKKRVKEIL